MIEADLGHPPVSGPGGRCAASAEGAPCVEVVQHEGEECNGGGGEGCSRGLSWSLGEVGSDIVQICRDGIDE